MSMKSVDGGDMPFPMSVHRELGLALDVARSDRSAKRFTATPAEVRAELQRRGIETDKINRYLAMRQDAQGRVPFDGGIAISAPKVKERR